MRKIRHDFQGLERNKGQGHTYSSVCHDLSSLVRVRTSQSLEAVLPLVATKDTEWEWLQSKRSMALILI